MSIALAAIAAAADLYAAGGRTRKAERLAKSYRLAQEKANRAAEGRYRQLLRGQEGLSRLGQRLEKRTGRRVRADITRGHSARLGNISQGLVSSGLSGTTVGASLRGGAERERVERLAGLEDVLGRQQFAREQSIEGARGGFIERRSDIGPDFGEMARISESQGAGGPFGSPGLSSFLQYLLSTGGGGAQGGTGGKSYRYRGGPSGQGNAPSQELAGPYFS